MTHDEYKKRINELDQEIANALAHAEMINAFFEKTFPSLKPPKETREIKVPMTADEVIKDGGIYS